MPTALLHLFSAWVLAASVLTPALAANASPADANYVLHPGDQLAVTVFGEPTLSKAATILPDGNITYPLVGQVSVAGRSVKAATIRLTTALRRYVKDPVVSIEVTQIGSYIVLVLGDVKAPGKYTLPSTARLADAIASAGGFENLNGSYPEARVSINNQPPVRVSLQNMLSDSDVNSNIPLGNETVVYVPGPMPIDVHVIGSVDKPGIVQIHAGDRLSMAIASAGTTTGTHADLSHIAVTRISPNGASSVSEYNLYNALKGGDLASDPVLAKNDEIYVPEAHGANALAGGLWGLLSRLIWL